ncbi:sugar transferase [Streptomyces antnestii]|uniref:Sugar transferase n=1 Tax=Streptomyces antnestii TaxID=2494256 RepID=A0A3S2VT80_9ACTN|nr:sugar transferase [Streptomyces sp. San01]
MSAYTVFRLAGEAHAGWYAVAAAAAWVVVRASRTRYAWRNLGERDNGSPLLRDWLILMAVLAVMRAATGEFPAFHLVLAGLVVCLPLAAACQGLTHRHLLARRRSGRGVRRALVIGEAAALDGLVNHLARRIDHAFVVVGVCPVGDDDPHLVAPITGRLDRHTPAQPSDDSSPVLAAARRLQVDLVFVVSGPSMAAERLRRLSWAVHEDGRPLVVVPGMTEVAQRRVNVSSLAGLTMLHVAPPVRRGAALLLKAVTDRVGAAVLLVLLAPVFVAVAIAVRLDSPGTILHRQIRVGRGGRHFSLAKFRTMVANAEQLRCELAGTNEQDGLMFKIRRDPRITRTGRVLRRFSLDELPQLFNVLLGHMSLVGPRPPLPDEVAKYNEVEVRRLSVKPGLTGLWQVSGRSDLSWDETVTLDLRYVDNWSPAVDFGILRRTVRAVLVGNGAY